MLNGELELERSEFVNNYAGGGSIPLRVLTLCFAMCETERRFLCGEVDGGVHMAKGRATMMQVSEGCDAHVW
eukprot:1738028-Rhodomonas_salina.3